MIVCIDVDHTLLLSDWRDNLIPVALDTGDWDAYHRASVKDKPSIPIINLAIALHNAGHEIYIFTAMPKRWQRERIETLHKYGIMIDYDHLLMRSGEDYRTSIEIKTELIADLNVDLVIEDREDVCLALGKLGITTMQVRNVS
jgi:hypothetical protein